MWLLVVVGVVLAFGVLWAVNQDRSRRRFLEAEERYEQSRKNPPAP